MRRGDTTDDLIVIAHPSHSGTTGVALAENLPPTFEGVSLAEVTDLLELTHVIEGS